MTNENELKQITKRLETIELMVLALLDNNAGGSQAIIGNSLIKANRLKQLLVNMGLE